MLQWRWECRYLFEILILFPLGIYPGAELLDHMAVLVLIIWETTLLFSLVAVPIYTPPGVYRVSLFSIPSPTFVSNYLLSNNRVLGTVPGIGPAALNTTGMISANVRLEVPCLFAQIQLLPPPSVPTEDAPSFCSSFPSLAFLLFQRA